MKIGESQWVGCPSTMFWRKSPPMQPMVSSEFASNRPFLWFQLPDSAGLFLVNIILTLGKKISLDRTKNRDSNRSNILWRSHGNVEYHIVAIIELKGENKTGSRQMFSSVFWKKPGIASGAQGPMGPMGLDAYETSTR